MKKTDLEHSMDLNLDYQHINIKNIRILLNMTQKEFIDRFFSGDLNKKNKISIATLSNIENKGSRNIDSLIDSLSRKLGINALLFSLEPESFIDTLETQFSNVINNEGFEQENMKSTVPNLVNRLTLYFADKILDGSLVKGDKIESDRELADKMNVGRSAIRESLKVLQVMGMIDIRPGQGTFISSETSNFFEVPLSWAYFMNSKQMYDVLQVRVILEEKSAELAAFSLNKDKLNKLGEIVNSFKPAVEENNLHKFLDLDMQFHITIAECSGNAVIISQILSIQNLLRKISQTGMDTKEELQKIYEEHLDIYNNIISKNGREAREAMRKHMELSFNRYKY